MAWPILVENFYSNFQKYKIGIISDEDELKELKKEITKFLEEKVKKIPEDAKAIEKL